MRILGGFVDFRVNRSGVQDSLRIIYIFEGELKILVQTGPMFSHVQIHFRILVRLSGSF